MKDASGGFVVVPKQQAVIRRMRRLKDRGLSLREIATAMQGAGVAISHVTVKNVLDAAASGPAAGELIEGCHVDASDLTTRHPEAVPRGRPMGKPAAPIPGRPKARCPSGSAHACSACEAALAWC
jgi:hypothetical protein